MLLSSREGHRGNFDAGTMLTLSDLKNLMLSQIKIIRKIKGRLQSFAAYKRNFATT